MHMIFNQCKSELMILGVIALFVWTTRTSGAWDYEDESRLWGYLPKKGIDMVFVFSFDIIYAKIA